MKKLFAFLLAMLMALSLAACGDDKDPAPSDGEDNTPSSSQQQEQPSSTPNEDETSGGNTDEPEQGILSDVDELLKGTGLTLEVIEPEQEEYESYAAENGTIRFYFPSMTVIETGNYYYQIMEACKAVADDGKIYEAENMVFSGTGDEAEFAPKPAEEYGDFAPTIKFGYYKDGTAFTVGITRSLDTVDGESKESLWFSVND